jgi:hypothetical protein
MRPASSGHINRPNKYMSGRPARPPDWCSRLLQAAGIGVLTREAEVCGQAAVLLEEVTIRRVTCGVADRAQAVIHLPHRTESVVAEVRPDITLLLADDVQTQQVVGVVFLGVTPRPFPLNYGDSLVQLKIVDFSQASFSRFICGIPF